MSALPSITPGPHTQAGRRAGAGRALAAGLAVWLGLTVWLVALPVRHGLRGGYFSSAAFDGDPFLEHLDAAPSSKNVYRLFRSTPPEAIAVRWSGFVYAPRNGTYTVATVSSGPSRLFLDGRLVVNGQSSGAARRPADADGELLPYEQRGSVTLTAGPHRLQIDCVKTRESRFAFDWSWSRDGGEFEDVPEWRLSPVESGAAVVIVPLVRWLWIIVSGMCVGLLARWLRRRTGVTRVRAMLAWSLLGTACVLAAAGWLYVAAAQEHARRVNVSKARADQSGYLFDAEVVYANWAGQSPRMLVGQRMRMPLYANLLALSYDPGWRNWDFFERAKIFNVRLSVCLMALLAGLFFAELPPLSALTLTLAVAFGYFVLRAGYVQPELLFYTIFFCCFLACWKLFTERDPARCLMFGVAAGSLAGLAYLTKALMPPFVSLCVGIFSAGELWRFLEWRRTNAVVGVPRWLVWRLLAGASVGVAFLLVVSPYLLTSKRVFGSYFFNANTTYYIWYDTGAEARARLLPLTDTEGRIAAPPEGLPNMGSYLRSHTLGQIAGRVGGGLREMAVDSYKWYLFPRYLALQFVIAVLLIGANRRAALAAVRRHVAFAVFLVAYAAVYLPSTAFFVPTSGTGGVRFLLAHVAPLMFTLTAFAMQSPFRDTRWRLGPATITAGHLQWALFALLAFDGCFVVWPHVMRSYGGF